MSDEPSDAQPMQEPDPIRRRDMVRPWLVALASAFLPGLGQLLAGRKTRAMVLFAITGAIVAVAGWLALSERVLLLQWTVRPDALRWMLVGNGLVLGFRVFAALDAYMILSRNTPRPSGVVAIFFSAAAALGAVVLIAAPHAVSGYAAVIQYDLITTVFAPAAVPQTTTTTTATATTPVPPTSPQPVAAVTTEPPATTTTEEPPPVIPARIWDGTERLNVLLLGGDMRPSSTSVRTDTIILTSIDPETGQTAMFSIPRNMARVPLPEDLDIWKCDCFPGIINALWRYGEENPDAFPDQGIPSGATALKLAIGEMTGLRIDYYALVNLTGFVELIDALGGVAITVPKRLYDPRYGTEDGKTKEVIDIAPGEYVMDGHTALAYARSRRSSDDYSRMGRQRCVLRAVAAQADPASVVRAFPAIAAAIKKNLTTDIPLEALPQFIELLPLIEAEDIVSVRFVPPQFTGPKTPDFYNTPDLDAIRDAIDVVFDLPPDEAIAELGLDQTREECG